MLNKDIIIIGSGIAGMTAAIYLKMAGFSPLIIEESTPGGQINKTSAIENYPGFNNIDGPTLAFNIFDQVTKLGVEFKYDSVKSVTKEEDSIIVKTNSDIFKCNDLIIASGRKPRKLGLENEEKLIGNGISFCAYCDGALYKDKEVIVVGGGNSAFSDCLYLARICKKVTLINRSNNFRSEKSLQSKVGELSNVNIIKNANIKEYIIANNKLVGVLLDNDTKLDTSAVFIAVGYEPVNDFIDCQKENGYIIVDDDMQTSINHIYAVGDAIKKDMYQLVTASSDGAIAAGSIIKSRDN